MQQPGREMYMPMNGYMPPNGWVPADAAYHQQMAANPMMGQYAGYQMAPQMGQMATTGSYMNGGTASYTMAPYVPMKAPQPGQQGQHQQRTGDLRDMISMYLPAEQVDPSRMMAGAVPPAAHVQAATIYQQGTPPSSEGNSVPLTHM